MASFNLDGFMNKVKDYSRPYLFYCKIFNSPLSGDHVYLVKSTKLPAQTITKTEADWQGNKYKLATTNEAVRIALDQLEQARTRLELTAHLARDYEETTTS